MGEPDGRPVQEGPRILRLLAFAMAGGVLSLALMALAARGTYPVGPGEVTVHVRPQFPGTTIVRLPPFGTIEARTHRIPVVVELFPRTIDVARAEALIERRPTARSFLADLIRDRDRALEMFGMRLAALGLAGGALAFGLLRGRRVWDAIPALLVGGILPLALYGAALTQYDPAAFREPTLTGALARSPALLGPAQQLGERLGSFRKELGEMTSSAFGLFQFLAEQSQQLAIPPDAVRILHISDLHLNPLGYDLASRVAQEFDVAAVIDTGDITAEGTEIEASFVERIREFSVPYIFVRGNHDSPVTQGAVAAQPGAVVLDGGVTDVRGLSLYGVGDPLFTPDKSVERATTAEQRDAKVAFATKVGRQVEELPAAPDVVIVHDRLIARRLVGRVPLVLSGHGHRWFSQRAGRTLSLGAASTGGAGLRSFGRASDDPVAMQVLYFDARSRRLLAYDRIEVRGPEQEFSLARTITGKAGEDESTPVQSPP